MGWEQDGTVGAGPPLERMRASWIAAGSAVEGNVASSTIKKLRMGTARRALVLNAPAGYVASLGEIPEGVPVDEVPEGKYDFVHLFVKDSTVFHDLIDGALEAAEYDALFWISYPKRSAKVETDLSRDVMWQLMGDTGLRPVAQVSIDEVWSALRFRPTEQVRG
jgi:hypothetical protein